MDCNIIKTRMGTKNKDDVAGDFRMSYAIGPVYDSLDQAMVADDSANIASVQVVSRKPTAVLFKPIPANVKTIEIYAGNGIYDTYEMAEPSKLMVATFADNHQSIINAEQKNSYIKQEGVAFTLVLLENTITYLKESTRVSAKPMKRDNMEIIMVPAGHYICLETGKAYAPVVAKRMFGVNIEEAHNLNAKRIAEQIRKNIKVRTL